MNFKTFVQEKYSTKYKKLNDLQLKIVDLVDETKDERLIHHIFNGKHACPYRIVQNLWLSYLSYYPNSYKNINIT